MGRLGVQDKCLGVTNYDVRPVGLARTGIISFVLVAVTLQRRDIAAIVIAVNCTVLGECGCSDSF